jgi:putative transcriptional regulator
MDDNKSVYLKGQLLMAMPGLADPNFSHTVTCICEHSHDGAVGVVVNRPHPVLSCEEVFNELKIDYSIDARSIPIYIGGPVHTGEIFVLHGPPFDWKGGVEIAPFLGLSNTRDILEAIAAGRDVTSYIIALGCAGWGKAQLETEIRANAWLTCPASEDLIFKVPAESRWEEALKGMGVNPLLLSNAAGRA